MINLRFKYLIFLFIMLFTLKFFTLSSGVFQYADNEIESNLNEKEIKSIYYKYHWSSHWVGYSIFQGWLFENSSVRVKYEIFVNEGWLESVRPYQREFDSTLINVIEDWDALLVPIMEINSWDYNITNLPWTVTDAPETYENLFITLVNGSVYNSSSNELFRYGGANDRSVPQDTKVIEAMLFYKTYLFNIVKEFSLTKTSTISFSQSFTIFLLFPVIVIIIRRKFKKV
ncbi:MAG: hypothetical protein HeimC3_34300 [Candidatus Heimdallarchaeota archaeon LC_3]|nr:MAG: hypothetical protein HeimC3_34300 [Candidatus Heimdallarchaeota archaeon LC_3]